MLLRGVQRQRMSFLVITDYRSPQSKPKNHFNSAFVRSFNLDFLFVFSVSRALVHISRSSSVAFWAQHKLLLFHYFILHTFCYDYSMVFVLANGNAGRETQARCKKRKRSRNRIHPKRKVNNCLFLFFNVQQKNSFALLILRTNL